MRKMIFLLLVSSLFVSLGCQDSHRRREFTSTYARQDSNGVYLLRDSITIADSIPARQVYAVRKWTLTTYHDTTLLPKRTNDRFAGQFDPQTDVLTLLGTEKALFLGQQGELRSGVNLYVQVK